MSAVLDVDKVSSFFADVSLFCSDMRKLVRMNVRPCMERLGITDAVLERKAEELLRKMQVKLPTLGKVENLC